MQRNLEEADRLQNEGRTDEAVEVCSKELQCGVYNHHHNNNVFAKNLISIVEVLFNVKYIYYCSDCSVVCIVQCL